MPMTAKTRAAVAVTVATKPNTAARATLVIGTVVFARTVPTTDSIRSATLSVQSELVASGTGRARSEEGGRIGGDPVGSGGAASNMGILLPGLSGNDSAIWYGRPLDKVTAVRTVLAMVIGAVLAALAAVILGEYNFSGAVPWVAGVAVPAIVGEATALVAGEPIRPETWLVVAALSAGGLAWGAWISEGGGLSPIPLGGWVAVALGALIPILFALAGVTMGKENRQRRPPDVLRSPAAR